MDREIVFEDVSKFYGEVLGVNNVNLRIGPGITSLVGPNGSGKTTLMNLMTGLVRPSRGWVSVLGISPERPEELFRGTGYCTQYDAFPKGMTGYEFLNSFLLLHGMGRLEAERRARQALEQVGLAEAGNRKVAAYSKGMRQRIKLAQALCHDPDVIVLDEPLNGLDPMARAETLALFGELASAGRHVIVSSHILHEVDRISDEIVLLSGGYVVAEGQIQGVRSEVSDHPAQILIRSSTPGLLASRLFLEDGVVEAKIQPDGKGLLAATRDVERFYLTLNRLVLELGIDVETVAPADADVHSVYQYLVGPEGGA
jgi:ABC-2 type transport system ATP-binding protein